MYREANSDRSAGPRLIGGRGTRRTSTSWTGVRRQSRTGGWRTSRPGATARRWTIGHHPTDRGDAVRAVHWTGRELGESRAVVGMNPGSDDNKRSQTDSAAVSGRPRRSSTSKFAALTSSITADWLRNLERDADGRRRARPVGAGVRNGDAEWRSTTIEGVDAFGQMTLCSTCERGPGWR